MMSTDKENRAVQGPEKSDRGRIRELTDLLNRASEAYYNENAEIMSNLEYDRLYDELAELEKRTGCGWVMQWSNRYLEEVRAGFVELDEDCAMLTCDFTELEKQIAIIPNEVIEVASNLEWTE